MDGNGASKLPEPKPEPKKFIHSPSAGAIDFYEGTSELELRRVNQMTFCQGGRGGEGYLSFC